MKLYDLVYSVVFQGNIRISMWCGDEEKIIGEWRNCEQLFSGDIEDEWMDFRVTYIFAPGDGWLHVEVTEDE